MCPNRYLSPHDQQMIDLLREELAKLGPFEKVDGFIRIPGKTHDKAITAARRRYVASQE